MQQTKYKIGLLKPPEIEIEDFKSIFSTKYKDFYFQDEHGIEESNYVFLQGNNLPQNWQNKEQFIIAETGFGTGLNFINTWKSWKKHRKPNQHLDFFSCELYPLSKEQLRSIYSGFNDLKDFSDSLISNLPEDSFSGFHRIHFEQENVTLTLFYGAAHLAFSEINFKVDAWYLDGFDPSRNPKMWSEELFTLISQKSKPNATLATFTVARKIKDRLQKVGFEISKRKGFGKKREMLTARIESPIPASKIKQPWFIQKKTQDNKKGIAIIGAGIAGLTLADKLRSRGQKVVLIDQHDKPMSGASGNPQAIVMPYLTSSPSIESKLYMSAFQFAQNYYHNDEFHSDGILKLANTTVEKQWQQSLIENLSWPESFITQTQEGLEIKEAGWLDTELLCNRLMKKGIEYSQMKIKQVIPTNTGYRLVSEDRDDINCSILILANGIHSMKLLPKFELPLSVINGQISFANLPESLFRKEVVLGKGYIMPELNGIHSIGASYEPIVKDKYFQSAQPSKDHWQKQLKHWENTKYHESLKAIAPNGQRAGQRVVTPDHIPMCGGLVEPNQFKIEYQDIKHGRHWKQYPVPNSQNGLYLFTGLGSRGFTSAPLLAEHLASQILGQMSPLDLSLQKSINPNRFMYKNLLKG